MSRNKEVFLLQFQKGPEEVLSIGVFHFSCKQEWMDLWDVHQLWLKVLQFLHLLFFINEPLQNYLIFLGNTNRLHKIAMRVFQTNTLFYKGWGPLGPAMAYAKIQRKPKLLLVKNNCFWIQNKIYERKIPLRRCCNKIIDSNYKRITEFFLYLHKYVSKPCAKIVWSYGGEEESL